MINTQAIEHQSVSHSPPGTQVTGIVGDVPRQEDHHQDVGDGGENQEDTGIYCVIGVKGRPGEKINNVSG